MNLYALPGYFVFPLLASESAHVLLNLREIPSKRLVEMVMGVHETRSNAMVRCVDHRGVFRYLIVSADSSNSIAVNEDIDSGQVRIIRSGYPETIAK